MYISHDLLVLLVLLLRLFQALLTLTLDMMDDDGNDIVMESPREDFPSLDAIHSLSVLKPVCRVWKNACACRVG